MNIFSPRSNFPLADVLGVDLVSEERSYAYDQDGKFKEGMVAVYLESAGHPLAKPISDGTVGLPGSFLKLRRTTAEEVMLFRLPVMVEDLPKDKWFNWGAPPPGTETAGSGVVYNKFGQGRALYIGAPIFRAIHAATGWGITDRPFWIREWIPALMQQLDPNPIAELTPVPFTEYVHGTFFYDKNKRSILVQILNAVELAAKGKYSGSSGVELGLDSRPAEDHRCRDCLASKTDPGNTESWWPHKDLHSFGRSLHGALPETGMKSAVGRAHSVSAPQVWRSHTKLHSIDHIKSS